MIIGNEAQRISWVGAEDHQAEGRTVKVVKLLSQHKYTMI